MCGERGFETDAQWLRGEKSLLQVGTFSLKGVLTVLTPLWGGVLTVLAYIYICIYVAQVSYFMRLELE